LASHHHSSYWKQHFRFGIIALSSLLLAWILSICSECYIYTKQINQLEQRLDQEFYALFPEMSDAIHPLQYPSIITSKISQMQKGGQSNRVSRVTTLQILSVISEDLSSNLDLQVEFLSLDQNQIRLNGQAQDFKTIDTVKKRLELNKLFTQVQILGANVDKRTKKVNFSLRLFTATV
jgi:type II secretory pathway component PulL